MENKLVFTSGEREEGRGNIGMGLKRYKLSGINKLQGYIVQHGEYSQYFILTINGK